MKHDLTNLGRKRAAFTLIELLIVIAIIAILAALLIPVSGAISRTRTRAKVRVELSLVQMAIENYKSKLGHYPPDIPGQPAKNQLYFELMGTTNFNGAFSTLDGSASIQQAEFPAAYGSSQITGFINCSGTGGGEEGRVARRFLNDLKASQVGYLSAHESVKFLCCSIEWPQVSLPGYPFPLGVPRLNPIRYNSSSPTNNPNSYDLWVDVVIAGKIHRINNWSKEPQIVTAP